MDAERLSQVRELFAAAAELAADQRADFLDRECAGEPELRREVASLLLHDDAPGDPLAEAVGQAIDEARTEGAAGPRLAVDERLGKYRIQGFLGAGGMGQVYEAVDDELRRPVALKLLPRPTDGEPALLARLRREARAVAALSHPNIVTLYSFEEEADVSFLTMELVSGQTLDRLVPADGLEPERFLELASPLADALAAAHRCGIVHRDLKPQNVMVSDEGRLKVLDFGLAQIHAGQTGRHPDLTTAEKLTPVGQILGTLPYMAPEQVRGELTTPASDVFSLGAVLYYMATGKPPFRGSSLAELASAILRDVPESVATLRPRLPHQLGSIIAKCLEKEVEQRPQAADRVRDDLETIGSKGGEPAETAIRLLAVLPLVDLAGEDDQSFFADGMTEALITDIARSGNVSVISRTSVMQLKGSTAPLKTIAADLGADAVVEGSVLRLEEQVRINVRLIHAATDTSLWAERYERRLEDVLTLQGEIAEAIAGELNRVLELPEPPRSSKKRKVDPEVYLLDLQGRHHWNRRTEEGALAGRRYFQQAVDLDPSYAPAHVGLADCYGMLANYGFQPPARIQPKALAAARRALELDPDSPEAHRVLAFIAWQFTFDWDGAREAYERSLELDPNDSMTTYWYAIFLGVVGHHEEGLDLLLRASKLDPLSLLITAAQGWLMYFARRYEKALPYHRQVLDLDPDYFVNLWFCGESLVELERYDEGIEMLERALDLSGRMSRLLGYLGYAYGRSGRVADARAALAEVEALGKTRYVPPYFAALILSGLGQTEETLARLEAAWKQGDTMMRDLRADSQWDWLRDEPRFEALMEAMAFPTPPPAARRRPG